MAGSILTPAEGAAGTRGEEWEHEAQEVGHHHRRARSPLPCRRTARDGVRVGESDSPVDAGRLLVATTTSLNDSGLLDDVVLPAYKELFPDVTVKVVAVGSGEAMAMGAKGEADVLMVHSPDDEAQFMADGNGTLRLPFAYNYFVIVGPEDDPAGVAKAEDGHRRVHRDRRLQEHLRLPRRRVRHQQEGAQDLGVGRHHAGGRLVSSAPARAWARRCASPARSRAYTLTDLGTFLSQQDTLDLARALQGDGRPEEHLRRHHREPEQVPHGERGLQPSRWRSCS